MSDECSYYNPQQQQSPRHLRSHERWAKDSSLQFTMHTHKPDDVALGPSTTRLLLVVCTLEARRRGREVPLLWRGSTEGECVAPRWDPLLVLVEQIGTCQGVPSLLGSGERKGAATIDLGIPEKSTRGKYPQPVNCSGGPPVQIGNDPMTRNKKNGGQLGRGYGMVVART